MNRQCSAAVSVMTPKSHRSPDRYGRDQLSRAAPSKRRPQISSLPRVNATTFERFLYWLGPDPEAAGLKYESIRGRLITMFRARRCVFAEDLADATFERVAAKLPDVTPSFTGDPALYFYGVAKKIYLEYQHEIAALRRGYKPCPPPDTDTQDSEKLLEQLDEALTAIQGSDRELILRYYTDNGHDKITHRRALARQLGIGPNALRLRVFRIRKEIKNRMLQSIPGPPSEDS